MASFFISYSRTDSVYANKIRNHLTKLDATHDVFLDIVSIKVGTNWKSELERKINACDYFIFIHSQGALKSKHVREELSWVAASELKTGLRKLIVYRLNYAEIIPEIAAYQVLDATDNFTIDFFRLMQGVYAGNSFYDVQYEIKLRDEFWYEGTVWIDAPLPTSYKKYKWSSTGLITAGTYIKEFKRLKQGQDHSKTNFLFPSLQNIILPCS